MISHAITIVMNEMNLHLEQVYNTLQPVAMLGNMAEGVSGDSNGPTPRERLIFSVVNIKEEKSLKNVPCFSRDDSQSKILYQNPPVFLNLLILLTATHKDYSDALLMLSRAISFFQYHPVFTQDSVAPDSLTTKAPNNSLDRLVTFKLIFDLYSPSLEEVNHLWGTLGGKQYPFVMYMLRMLDLKFAAAPTESAQIIEVVHSLRHQIKV